MGSPNRVARPIWPDRAATRCNILSVGSENHVSLVMDVDGESSCAFGTRPQVVGPPSVSGYRFADAAAKTIREKQWYQTDLLEVIPLKELPPGFETTH